MMFVHVVKCSYFEHVHGLSVDFIYPQSSSRVFELVKNDILLSITMLQINFIMRLVYIYSKEINMKQFDIHDWFNYIIFKAQVNYTIFKKIQNK